MRVLRNAKTQGLIKIKQPSKIKLQFIFVLHKEWSNVDFVNPDKRMTAITSVIAIKQFPCTLQAGEGALFLQLEEKTNLFLFLAAVSALKLYIWISHNFI